VGPFDPDLFDLPEAPGFRVIAAVGAGSRGSVFRARDLTSQDVVALKVLEDGCLAALADAPGLAAGASPDEAKSTGRLDAARHSISDLLAHLTAIDSPGLVTPRRVVEVARKEEDGGPALALVMEFVEGDSLARALQRNVRFAPAHAAGIARKAAAALIPAHAAGFVHGGLHPGKIVLGEGEVVRVLGAGLGETPREVSEEGAAAGRTSPCVYAANEVLAGDRPSEAADVFSLGAILYHLLTGLPPYKSRGLGALRVERADGPLVWPRGAMEELPPRLIALVDRMASPAPSDRPRLDHAFLSELASSPKSRRMLRPVRARVEPPRDVAPLEEPRRARAGGGRLRGAASAVVALLKKPNAAAVVMGGATVVFLLALAVALRSGPEQDPPPDETPIASTPEAPREPGGAAPVEPPAPERPGHDSLPPAPDPDLAELEAIEQVFEENPADAEAYRGRVEGLAARAGDIGVRATALLAGLNRYCERRAEEELARILDRAAALEAGGRYGSVLVLLKGFPHDRYPGTAASSRARVEAEATRRRASEAFARTERRARDLLVAGDFAGARAEYESVKNTIGIEDLVERAEEALRRVGELEEEAAEAEAERRAKANVESLRQQARRAIADLARLCRRFRYTEAEKRLAAGLANIKLAREDLSGDAAERIAREQEDLDDYGQLVRWEIAQFRRVAARIRSGEKEASLGFVGGPAKYPVRAISERGLTVTEDEGEGRLEFTWDRLPDNAAYVLMMERCGNGMSIRERLAVAVFAHHRGMDDARDNELRVAGQLARTPDRKAIVRQVRELLDRIETAP